VKTTTKRRRAPKRCIPKVACTNLNALMNIFDNFITLN
jgi:hypothetical protein